MVQLRDLRPQIAALGFELLGISPDRPAKLRETLAQHQLGFLLLSDSRMEAARAFRIAYRVDEPTLQKLAKLGVNLEEYSGETHHLLSVPGVFLVSTSAAIEFEFVHPNHAIRLHPDILLAAARAHAK